MNDNRLDLDSVTDNGGSEVKAEKTNKEVKCLGKTFASDEERREYFREELRKKLPELKKMEGFPIGEDDDIINLSDPPYYTACPNPWLNDFIAEWEEEKKNLETRGKRKVDFDVDNPYSVDVSEGKNNPIYNAHTYHTKVPHPAIMRYLLHYTQPGDIVLDGFAGTGMTGVAAQMCGHVDQRLKLELEQEFKELGLKKPVWGFRNSICSDLSPIASFIAYNYNSKINVRKFCIDARKVLAEVKKECDWMYRTKHSDGSFGIINYIVWADKYVCNNCGSDFNYYEATVKKNNGKVCVTKTLLCPHCNTVYNHSDLKKKFVSRYNEKKSSTNTVVDHVPVLINYSSSNGKGRFEKKPDADDLEIIKEIEGLHFSWYPEDKLHAGYNLSQPMKTHNIEYVHQFYEKRTLYVLSKLYELIGDNKQIRFVFTSMLPKVTNLNRYMPQHGSRALVGPKTNTLYYPPMHVEHHVIDQFEFQLNKIIKAFELTNTSVVDVNSATCNVVAENTIDYIFTDPPFGANIMYSELNFITECWLKEKTNNQDEAIQNDAQEKGLAEYMHLMTRAFKNYYSYLKPGRWLTVEFSNTSNAVWNGIRSALSQAGFVIASVAGIDKERPGLFGMTTTTAVNEDLAIQCYKPSSKFIEKIEKKDSDTNIWAFVDDYLKHLAFPQVREEKAFTVNERNPKIIYDKVITYFLMKGLPIPLDASEFQEGLKKRFVFEDGMVFTHSQITEYAEVKKRNNINPSQISMGLDLIVTESDAIAWLNNQLNKKTQTYQELQPDFRRANMTSRKGENPIELKTILEENYIQQTDGSWRVPNMNEAKDRETLRNKALLKLWDSYCKEIDELEAKGKRKKIKEVRLEAVKAGFKKCFQEKDFARIKSMGDSIPENILTEDETLLNYYDIACTRV